jgi:hypothetical protein
MSKSFNYAVLFLLISGTACIAQSDQPSLGDLARKHRAEVKQAKTLTNDDVATVQPSAPTSSAASTPAASSTALPEGGSNKTETKENSKKSEPVSAASKDTPEVAELKSKISSYKAEQDGWKKAVKRNQDLLENETDSFRRQMYQDRLQGDQSNVQLFQDRIDQAQADLVKAEKASSSNH